MGEVSTSPEVADRAIQDLTAIEVDPEKGERLFKAAVIKSNSGVFYRLLSKSLTTGKVDLVHYGCDLDETGHPKSKWRIRRILEQHPGRFDQEIEGIKKSVADEGEQVSGVWVHDLTPIHDVAAQGESLESWMKQTVREAKTQG